MSSGKTHAVVGMVSGVLTWVLISFVHLYWSGLYIAIMFGAILAKFPDIDKDIHIIWGHRSPLTHSALLPAIAVILALITGDFVFTEVAIYWGVVHGSHLLADIDGKASNHVTWYFLLLNGLGLIIAGLAAGVYLL